MRTSAFFSILALAFLAAPQADATLQIAVQIGPDLFTCAEGQACDTSAVTGVLATSATTIDGILFSSATASAESGPLDFLNASSLLLTNTLKTPITITIAVGATGFTAPVAEFATAASGVWQGPGGLSAATFQWFVDPANAQGAATATDTPGALIDSDLSTSLPITLAFAHNGFKSDALSAPYSMTEQLSLVLAPGESLVNRGQTIVGAAIPEPSTWAMLVVGFIGLAWGSFTRRRVRSLQSAL